MGVARLFVTVTCSLHRASFETLGGHMCRGEIVTSEALCRGFLNEIWYCEHLATYYPRPHPAPLFLSSDSPFQVIIRILHYARKAIAHDFSFSRLSEVSTALLLSFLAQIVRPLVR